MESVYLMGILVVWLGLGCLYVAILKGCGILARWEHEKNMQSQAALDAAWNAAMARHPNFNLAWSELDLECQLMMREIGSPAITLTFKVR